MTELKPGWQRVKFGEVVRLNKETCNDPAAAGLERVIGLEHLEPGDLRVRFWADVADGTTFTNRVRPGQLLFRKNRAYPRKVAVADFDAVCSGDIYVLESADLERLLPEFLPFMCQTETFFEHAVGTSAGSLSPRTNWNSLSQFELALPSLEEQLRISRLLESSRATVDALEEANSASKQLEATLFERRLSELDQGTDRHSNPDVPGLLPRRGSHPHWLRGPHGRPGLPAQRGVHGPAGAVHPRLPPR